jgi:hypothetical protein
MYWIYRYAPDWKTSAGKLKAVMPTKAEVPSARLHKFPIHINNFESSYILNCHRNVRSINLIYIQHNLCKFKPTFTYRIIRRKWSIKKKGHPCNRPWRTIGLWDVEILIFSRQMAQRWRWGCQPYAPVSLYPIGRFPVLISVRGWVDPRSMAWSERLRELKNPVTSSGIEPRPSVL